MLRRFLLLPLAVLLALLVSGCGLSRPFQEAVEKSIVREEWRTEKPVELPAEQPAEAANPSLQESVKLVPLPSELKCCVELSYPEGWVVMPTGMGDSVQIAGDRVRITLMTTRLQGPAPLTVDEYRALPYEFPTEEVTITQQSVPGTVSAFEVRYVSPGSDGEPEVDHSFVRFGGTYRETLRFSMPAKEFTPEWEGLFYRIAATYKHSNLDATPLPGRP